MGQIQSAINQGITGTAFILNQAGALENVRKNYQGQKALKEDIESAKIETEALEEYGEEREGRILTPAAKKALDAELESTYLKHAKNQSDIKLRTPKYRN